MEGIGEPLVTDMNDVDRECYLDVNDGYLDEGDGDVVGDGGDRGGECDVLFPTDFDRLAEYAERVLEISLRRK